MPPPTPDEVADLTLPKLLNRVRDSRYFSLERPATAAELASGEAAWRRWFGIEMPAAYRELLAPSNGLDVNGLLLVAAEEYTVVEDDRERRLPGIDSENADYLDGIAEHETRRFFARRATTCSPTTWPRSGGWSSTAATGPVVRWSSSTAWRTCWSTGCSVPSTRLMTGPDTAGSGT